VALGLQVGLEAAQQRHAVPALPLQGPVAVEPLHELALPGDRQVAGDLAQPGGNKRHVNSPTSGHERTRGVRGDSQNGNL